MNPISRTAVREHIFKIIFGMEFSGDADASQRAALYLDNLTDEEDRPVMINAQDREYIIEKSQNISGKLPEIDAVINKHAKGWSVSRLGKAELAILRVAVYEILFDDDIPDNVAINEAIELTKIYGEATAPAFINGILASVKA